MGWGIKEPAVAVTHVPGTAVLLEDSPFDAAKIKDGDIVLVPRPSKSPNDPLNWPMWKKDLTLFSICFSICLGAIQGPILSTVTVEIVKELKIPITKAENLSSYPNLACACACILSSVFARLIGKRPVYIFSTACLLIGNIWTAAQGDNYDSFFGARFIFGIGLGAYEAIVLSSIGDMYFVHQRGRRIAFYNLLSLGPVNFSPILSGYIADKYGWRMNSWILTPFLCIAMILVVLFCPETSYNRPLVYETDIISTGDLSESSKSSEEAVVVEETTKTGTTSTEKATASSSNSSHEENAESSSDEKPRKWLEELKPVRGIENHEQIWVPFVRLFACIFYPAVWWAFIVGGTFVAWFLAITVTLAQIFAAPPVGYTPTQVGHLATFPTIGAIAAFILMHTASDWTCKWLARRNNRVYEPEFRLFLIIPVLIIGVPGLACFGYYAGTASPTHEINWVVTSFIYGMIVFVTVLAQADSFAYLLDAHRDVSIEVAVFTVMLRNFFSFASTDFLGPWLEKDGVAKVFYAIAGLQGGCILFTIPMYFYGKIVREFFHRHSPFKMLHVEVKHRTA